MWFWYTPTNRPSIVIYPFIAISFLSGVFGSVWLSIIEKRFAIDKRINVRGATNIDLEVLKVSFEVEVTDLKDGQFSEIKVDAYGDSSKDSAKDLPFQEVQLV